MGKTKADIRFIIDEWWMHWDYLSRGLNPSKKDETWLDGLMDAPERSVFVRMIPRNGILWIRLVDAVSPDRFDSRPVAQKIAELYAGALPSWPRRTNVTTVTTPRSGRDTFVPVQCLGDLLYAVRDGKLQDCPISIPALGIEAKSVYLSRYCDPHEATGRFRGTDFIFQKRPQWKFSHEQRNGNHQSIEGPSGKERHLGQTCRRIGRYLWKAHAHSNSAIGN